MTRSGVNGTNVADTSGGFDGGGFDGGGVAGGGVVGGGVVGVTGVTGVDGFEVWLTPTPFVAVTVNVYADPFANPITGHDNPAV